MKNAVIIHLESLSKLIYQMNEDLFPNLNRMKLKCMNYNYFFSTATSTAMAMSDITYGDFYRAENTERFGNFIYTHPEAESFVDVLSHNGYRTLGIHYPEAIGDEINPGNMYAMAHKLVNYSNYSKAVEDVKNTIDLACENDEKFLIYFCNEVSHLCYSDHKKKKIANPVSRWKYGYKKVDETIGDIIGYLEKKKLLDDTVIILYGDHGDDLWGHGFNGGYSHVVEPYANLIHTPLMIYDSSIGYGVNYDIVCTLDIKQILYNLIAFERQENPYIYDRYRSKRKYVFSRNLYAAQEPQKIDACISNILKSYAVTTKEYSLVLNKRGYRMYHYSNDPTCHNNVLDYFVCFGTRIKYFMKLKHTQIQYRTYMGAGAVDEIEKSYYMLRKLMRNEINKLEQETQITEVLSSESCQKIYYTKNVLREYIVLRLKGFRRTLRNWYKRN